ncbi:hypothetical protein L2E82_50354 [Cichorium intybus]|nr:hypothetical protein L2E82_50354 [Cichorium intybus]
MSSDQSVPHSNPGNVTSILSLCSKVTLDGTNYNDWIRNIKMTLRFEHKEYVLETELVEVDPDTATPEEIASYTKHSDHATKVACIMIATMNPELQRIYEDYWPYEMHKELAEKFRKMQGYVERLRKLEMPVHDDLAVDIVLNSLLSSYDQFTLAYHLNNSQATLAKLHRMLRTAEDGMKGKSVLLVNPPVLAIGSGKGKKRKGPPKQNRREKTHVGTSNNAPRAKSFGIPHITNPKEADCFYCKEKGHWKRSCPRYLQDIKDGKVKPSQGLEESRELEHGRLNLVMGNTKTSPVTKIGVYRLHCRLGHINKKRIAQLQRDGVLESFDLGSDDVCESCLLGKMTKSPFKGSFERETAAHILNLVPTKKVAKTPHEMWTGKVPSLAHIKVWGCEAFVRRETHDKIAKRSERCFFIGYPKQSFGYLFYRPSEDVVFVARRGFFRERELISKEDSGSTIDLEEIQETPDEPTLGETSNQKCFV